MLPRLFIDGEIIGMREKEKRKRIPFWWQIVIILFCGAIVAAGVYGTARYIQWRQYEDSLPVYTVAFAYQSGEVIETKQVKEGRGVHPPEFDAPGVFQGWSKPINNITEDTEVHPLYYSIADENLFCFDSVYVKEGEEFTVKLMLTGEVNISSAELTLQYDTDVMEFVKSNDKDHCALSDKGDGNLILQLSSDAPLTEKTLLSEIRFKALKKDVYSSQIDLICKNAKLKQSGVDVPATVSTLNNKIYYLQEVDNK